MKTWKRLISGLFALVLLASLAGSALAAEAAKKEVPKPTGQFTQWFPWMGADPDAPEASEAVLAQMGTVINQTKTVGGETLTLNGALWEGDSVHLSFTAKSPHFPADLSKDSWVNSDKCTALMPEKQWMDYARKRLEAGLTEEDLAKEGLESRLQNAMKQGQAEFDPRLSVYSREGNTVTFRCSSIPLEAVLEKTELTLHIENVTLVETDKATGMPLLNGKSAGTVLKGPFDFTFTLDQEKAFSTMNYTGGVSITYGKVPLRVMKVSISPTGMGTRCGIDAEGPVNLVDHHRNRNPVSGKTNIDLDKDLDLGLNGFWTKDGKYIDCSKSMGFTGVLTPADEKDLSVNWSRNFPYPIDPAGLVAVDIGGTRVELNALKPVTRSMAN